MLKTISPLLILTTWLLALGSTPWSATASSRMQELKGEVLSDKNAPISGALCTIAGGHLPETGLSAKTGEMGEFSFTGLLPGVYDLTCAAVGYEPVAKRGLEVGETGAPFVQMVLPGEIVVREKVEVRDKAGTVAQESTAPPATISEQQLRSLPLAQQRFKAALPLVPGVVRTPDGKINIKGVVENQGMLLVDSAETVDPVTGAFSIEVPIDAVGSIEVFKNPYRAEYGRFSGGLTSVLTKAPSSQWRFELNDLTPNIRIKNGQIVGINEEKPRFTVSGPLWPNKLNIFESFHYNLDKRPVRGLPWPQNEIKTEGFDSFTSAQYIISAQHLLTLNAKLFPMKRQFANINSLVPQPASADYGQGGYSVGGKDRYLFNSGGILTALVQFTKFSSHTRGQGPLEMLVTPNGWGGNFFNDWRREARQQEASLTYQFRRREWHGGHELIVGGEFIHRDYTGTSVSRPIQVLRPSGTLVTRIDFLGSGKFSAGDTEITTFIQDHWALTNRLALDLGLRYSGQTRGDPTAVAPRLGLLFSPGGDGKTILRGGVGLFYDRLPLLAADFTHNPTRQVTLYDEQGQALGPPLVYNNVYVRRDDKGQHVMGPGNGLQSTPYNLTWNLELNRELTPHVILRLSYLSSRTYNLFISNPQQLPGADPVLLLTNTGGSRYHELESTLRLRASEKADVSVSYVHSRARGDLNTLSEVYVPFEAPIIRPNVYANLPANVPHRLVTWGRFKIPWKITASPVFDLHTGFPYSNLDVRHDYVGVPNSRRFPVFLSLDLEMSKDFRIKFLPWIRNHTLRGALRIFNVTNHFNPRDVFNNIASSSFGHFAGLQHRSYDTSLSIIY